MKNVVLLLLWLILIQSCGSVKDKTPSELPSGKWTDTIYYPSGQIHVIQDYIDTVRNGEYVEYFGNGNVMYQTTFESGKPFGDGKEFFSNGILKSSFTYNKGNFIGTKLNYFETGELQGFWFYDLNGRGRYNRRYSAEGKFLGSEGNPFTDLMLFGSQDSVYALYDTVFIYCFVATPPDCDYQLLLTEKKSNSKSVEISEHIDHNLFLHTLVTDQTGHFFYDVVLRLEDKSETKIWKRSFDFKVRQDQRRFQGDKNFPMRS